MSQPAKNPNAVDLPRTDGKCATGGCPHLKEKVQLIPLRYGLVERLDPSAEVFLPYKTASRPMGIRLLRDGWLYVIDNSTGYMHEYEVKGGVVTKCIWQGKEAAKDKRSGSAGENALVFTRGSTLHVAYAEVQWTANKCSQMLKSSKERDLFMQIVKPAGADPEKGGKHLLTDKQAEKWIAEVAEKPSTETPPEGAHPEESKDYIWEDQKDLFKATQLGAIKKSLLPIYEKDHFFLVIKDSIGVMRDLAQDQDTVVGWLEEWALKEKNDLRYSIGNYIETLMVVSEKSAKQAGTSDALFERTTPEQREKIYDYVNAKNDLSGIKTSQPEKAYYPGRGFDAKTRAAQQNVALKKQTMEDSLGKDLYKDLKDDIEVLEDKSHAAVEGKGLGARGIHDLVRHEEMTKYLESERSHMKRWTARLNSITSDRIGLFTKSEYHLSAWYFDVDMPEQLKSALVTEQNCVRDLCRTEESMAKLSNFMHGAPYYSLPLFSTRLTAEYFEKKIPDLIKWLDDKKNLKGGIEEAKERVTKVEALMGRHWTTTLSPDALNCVHGINAAYSPAIALGVQEWLTKLQDQINTPKLNEYLEKIYTHSNRAHRLGTIIELKQEGVTLKVSTEKDKDIFLKRMNKLGDLLETEKQLKKDRNLAQKNAKRRVISGDEQGKIRQANAKAEKIQLNNQLFLIRKERQLITAQIQDSTTVTSTIDAGYIGVKLNLDSTQQRLLDEETSRLKQGVMRGYGESGAGLKAFKSSTFPLAALFFQAANLGEAFAVWKEPEGKSTKELIVALGALAGAAAAAISVIQNAYIAVVDNAFKSITASTAGKGGTLFTVKLGKLGLGLGVLIAPLTFISAAATMWDNWGKWTDALRTGTAGEKAGALLAFTGDIGNTSITAVTTYRALSDFSVVGRTYFSTGADETIRAVGYAWGTRGVRYLGFSSLLTPWSLGFTALQLGGEALFNYFNLDDQQRWMLNCCWGVEDSKWDWNKHAQKLAESSLRPTIIDAGIAKSSSNDNPIRTLQLIFPGVSIESLKRAPIKIQAELIQQYSIDGRDVAELVCEHMILENVNPLTLNLEIPDDWCGEQSQLKMRLSVQPDMANKPLKSDDDFLYYPVSLLASSKNKPLTGDSSVKPSRLSLKWAEVKMENIHE